MQFPSLHKGAERSGLYVVSAQYVGLLCDYGPTAPAPSRRFGFRSPLNKLLLCHPSASPNQGGFLEQLMETPLQGTDVA